MEGDRHRGATSTVATRRTRVSCVSNLVVRGLCTCIRTVDSVPERERRHGAGLFQEIGGRTGVVTPSPYLLSFCSGALDLPVGGAEHRVVANYGALLAPDQMRTHP